MDADIRGQETSYRRGLVLGLTMAEIIVLVLFTLLLALSSVLASKERRIAQISEQVDAKNREIAVLNDKVNFLAATVDRNRFDDLFRELELARAEARQVPSLKAELREAQKRAEKHQALERIVVAAGRGETDPEKVIAELVATRAASERLAEAMKMLGDGIKEPAKLITELAEKLRESERQNNTLQGQLSNLRRTLEAAGRGTEMPACWASADTGKPEYIFDVGFTASGIIVRDNALPARAEEQRRLPLDSMVFGKEINLATFLTNAKALYEWSVAHKCRFFVQAFDLTKPDEKAAYKTSLRTVGQRFYHYEVLDRSF